VRQPATTFISGGNFTRNWIKGDTISSTTAGEWSWRTWGDESLAWFVSADQPWLTLQMHDTDNYGSWETYARITSQANALAVGTYKATVTFRSGVPPWATYQTRTVTLKVVRPGDINADFAVDVADLLWMVSSWEKSLNQPGFHGRCDINRDRTVDMADLLLFMANWGEGLEEQPE
jgi:hypothetical protein